MAKKDSQMIEGTTLGKLDTPDTAAPKRRVKDVEKTEQNITYFVTLGTHKRLKMLAIERNTTLQGLIDDAIDRMLLADGHSPIERRGE